MIRKIHIINSTEFGPYTCSSCLVEHFSPVGSSLCYLCGANHYIDQNNACIECPEMTYSKSKSIGKDSCVQTLPCKDSNFMKTYGSCINGKISARYTLREDSVCDLSDWKIHEIQLDCNECEEGEYIETTNNLTTCSLCPNGK